MRNYTCPYCLSVMDEQASVCKVCGREVQLVRSLQKKIDELLVSTSTEGKEVHPKKDERKQNKKSYSWFALTAVIYILLSFLVTFLSYKRYFNDRFYGIEFQVPELLVLSFLFGFTAIFLSYSKNVYVNALYGFAICLLVLPIVKIMASMVDYLSFSDDLLLNSLKSGAAVIIGSAFAIMFDRNTSFKVSFNLMTFFNQMESSQSSFEKIEKFVLKISTVVTFIVWMLHILFPRL